MPVSPREHRNQLSGDTQHAIDALDKRVEELRQAAAARDEKHFSVPLHDDERKTTIHQPVMAAWADGDEGWIVKFDGNRLDFIDPNA